MCATRTSSIFPFPMRSIHLRFYWKSLVGSDRIGKACDPVRFAVYFPEWKLVFSQIFFLLPSVGGGGWILHLPMRVVAIEIINNTRGGIGGEIWSAVMEGKLKSRMNTTHAIL